MDKKLKLDLIKDELETVRSSKILLMKMLGKNKKRSEYESKILHESLEQSREREQELLNQRHQIQTTTGNK